MNNSITLDTAVGVIYRIPDSSTCKIARVTSYGAFEVVVLKSETDWTEIREGVCAVSLDTLNYERIILYNPYTSTPPLSNSSPFQTLFPFNLRHLQKKTL
jgi:hypothetical protein